MSQVLSIILPVFLVVAAGYAGGRSGYLPREIADYLNAYAVRLALPFLLFVSMSELDFSTAFDGPMLLSFYAGSLICFVLAIVLARRVWRRRPGEAVSVGFAAMFSNTIMIGVPIAERAYGTGVLMPAFGIIGLHASLLYVVGIITMEMSRRDGRPFGETMKRAIRAIFANPLMIGILCGLAANLAGVAVPAPAAVALDMVAASAIPVALIGIGISITRFRIQEEISESLMIAVLSLAVHPTIAFVLSHVVFGLPADLVRAAVILAATPPGNNVYIFAKLYERGTALAASSILIAMVLSIFTISTWLVVLEWVFP